MRFEQFFEFLNEILYKEDTIELPSHENFSYFLMCRYLSMINPLLTIYLNEHCNNSNLSSWFEDEISAKNFLKAIVPKCPRTKIEYIKKTSTEKFNKTSFTEEDVIHIAEYFEISQREARELLTQAKNKVK